MTNVSNAGSPEPTAETEAAAPEVLVCISLLRPAVAACPEANESDKDGLHSSVKQHHIRQVVGILGMIMRTAAALEPQHAPTHVRKKAGMCTLM